MQVRFVGVYWCVGGCSDVHVVVVGEVVGAECVVAGVFACGCVDVHCVVGLCGCVDAGVVWPSIC